VDEKPPYRKSDIVALIVDPSPRRSINVTKITSNQVTDTIGAKISHYANNFVE